MRRLYVLYDAECGLCSRIRRWAEARATYVDLEFVAAQSERARRWFPTLVRHDRRSEELVVVSDEGGVYREDSSWIMVLYATHEYRAWSLRLARPGLLPYARRAFRALTDSRQTISDALGLVSDAELAAYLERTSAPSCATEGPR